MINRTKLILDNMELAEKIASSKKKTTPVSYDELRSAAYMGLVEAANRYTEEIGTQFDIYAQCRIFGAIKDYLRECAWGSRNNPVNIQELHDQKTYQDKIPGEFFEKAAKNLDNFSKNIFKKYYLEEKSAKEIASQVGLSEGRISQILTYCRQEIKTSWMDRQEELSIEFAA